MFLLVGLVVPLALSGGCATMGEVTTKNTDGTVTYTSVPVRRGEIHLKSLPDKTVEAEITLDGQPLVTQVKGKIRRVGPMRSGEKIYDIWVDRIGEHTLSGSVYTVEGGRRGDYVGEIDLTFYVDPHWRDCHASYGHWWRVDVYPP